LLTRKTDLALHVQDIANVLEFESLQDVVLVGHSYGGMVITGVAELASERIGRLVYVDAFVPKDGQSVFDLRPDVRDRWTPRLIDGWLIPPTDPTRFGVSDEADLAWLRTLHVPMPVETHSQPLRTPEALAERLPRSYLYFEPGGGFGDMARQARSEGWDYHEVVTGHDGIITAPVEVAAILAACADES
jgi:pimeloyl-ACP methyl ester carboxylesterase